MSPIIYIPHACEASALGDLPYGTIWQCETCQALWVATSSAKIEWAKIEDPRREHSIEDASRRAPALPAAPTVTPDMVQLVLDEYEEHGDIGRLGNAWWCTRCADPIPQGLTPAGHARSMAAAALQDALDKAGRDAQE